MIPGVGLGGQVLRHLDYEQLTVGTITPVNCTVPPGCKLITFTCEDVMIRWLPTPMSYKSDGTPIISTAFGNPLPISTQNGQFEYLWQTSVPLTFISQGDDTDTTLVSKVNVNYWGD